ncbi:TPA: transglycosylase SLT domain-containing protein [Salmonella enterica]|nr:transglycosylase SLT domain-containing protein [Salmonella enterica]MCH5744719.1 transglycosylase SLT domain-containing protein [Salmonella enterica]MCH5749678.1 transglycosylase SLT domain-containing protein [Salmonella enterica]MCH5757170.1 transglycosylase SLT domain-containing protein [Salmonella enterica]MCH5770143.1 transglycosylase SLT domain-containing protein [Salmonella enterica]
MNVNVEELVYLVKLRADDFLKGKATIDAELVKLGKSVGEATDSLAGVGDAANAAGDELESAGKKATDAGEDFKGAGDKVESAGDEFESAGEKAEGAGKKVSGAGKKSRKAGKDTDSLGKSLKQTGKDAAKFGKTTANSFSKVTKYALGFFGVALTLEGARRFFTGMTTDILALSNAASFMDMPIKQMDGFHKAAEAAGSSAAVVDGVLMKMQNAVNWKKIPMANPDASTLLLAQIDGRTGQRFQIMAQKNAKAMMLATARALRSMPKAMAEQYAGAIGIDSGMFADIRSGAFEKNQGDYAKKSGQSDENAKRAREIKKTLVDLQTTAENIENAIYGAFGDEIDAMLKKFDGDLQSFGKYIIDHKDDIVGFFRDAATDAGKFATEVGGAASAMAQLINSLPGGSPSLPSVGGPGTPGEPGNGPGGPGAPSQPNGGHAGMRAWDWVKAGISAGIGKRFFGWGGGLGLGAASIAYSTGHNHIGDAATAAGIGWRLGGWRGAVAGAAGGALWNVQVPWLSNHGVYVATDRSVFFSKEEYEKYQSALDRGIRPPKRVSAPRSTVQRNDFYSGVSLNGILGVPKQTLESNFGVMPGYDPDAIQQHAQSARRRKPKGALLSPLLANYNAMLEDKYGLPPGSLSALAMAESSGNPYAVSKAGALGAYQIMPKTGAAYGMKPSDFFNPLTEAGVAAKILSENLRHYQGNLQLALAAYNGGMGRVDKALNGRGMLPEETLNYPDRVMSYMDETRHYYANAGAATSPGAIDNSQTSATHINTVNVNGSPQTVDELTQSILEQSRRSGLTGGFLTGVS